jgi:hypothetical protein
MSLQQRGKWLEEGRERVWKLPPQAPDEGESLSGGWDGAKQGQNAPAISA